MFRVLYQKGIQLFLSLRIFKTINVQQLRYTSLKLSQQRALNEQT